MHLKYGVERKTNVPCYRDIIWALKKIEVWINMVTPSQLFFNKTGRKNVFNIQPIENISSVICYGILSYNWAIKIKHESIAMPDVQGKRETMNIPGVKPLHYYANAYFDPRNPMMYKRKDIAQSLCVLAISSSVLDLQDTVITDGNAASEYSRFYSPIDGISKLDFNQIYDEYWDDDDCCRKLIKKRIKCAEVLVLGKIDYEYIVGAYVVNKRTECDLRERGFQKKIVVNPNVFFCKG